jgi:hypothetical protein
MFTKSETATKLDAEINALLDCLKKTTKDSKEYDMYIERIAKLHKLKTEEKSKFKPISSDTVLLVAANIFGILWLARYEKTDVIKSKTALGFVMKPR